VLAIYNTLSKRNQIAYDERVAPLVGGTPFGERDPPSESDVQGLYASCIRLADALDQVHALPQSDGQSADSLDFADIGVLAILQMLFAIIPEDQFKHILDQDDGRLGRLYERAKPFLNIQEGEWFALKSSSNT
jgi:hypothetical protein